MKRNTHCGTSTSPLSFYESMLAFSKLSRERFTPVTKLFVAVLINIYISVYFDFLRVEFSLFLKIYRKTQRVTMEDNYSILVNCNQNNKSKLIL